MNLFATSNVAFRCWERFWYSLAFGWQTFLASLALGSGSAWVSMWSDSHTLLMVDFWHLSKEGAMAPAGYRKFGNGVRAMTVLAWLHFFGTGIPQVCGVISCYDCARCMTCLSSSKSYSSILEGKVDSPGTSLQSSLISEWVSLSSYLITIITQIFVIYNTILHGRIGNSHVSSAIKIRCLL